MACNCNQNTQRQKVDQNSSITVFECDHRSPFVPKEPQIIVPYGNDVPLALRLFFGEKCDKYSIDIRDVKDLKLTISSESYEESLAHELVYSLDAVCLNMIHFRVETVSLEQKEYSFYLSGTWRGNRIFKEYNKKLKIVKPSDDSEQFREHVCRPEIEITEAVFIPSALQKITELENTYTAKLKELDELKKELKEEIDKIKYLKSLVENE